MPVEVPGSSEGLGVTFLAYLFFPSLYGSEQSAMLPRFAFQARNQHGLADAQDKGDCPDSECHSTCGESSCLAKQPCVC